MKLINLGCGWHYHKDWINLDSSAGGQEVVKHNLLEGIPFPDNYFDVVYHSHVLEHFSKTDAIRFIQECHRVLVSGGVIRIAVPDLETIVEEYKKWLELALQGDQEAQANYDWIMLELYDQCVRNYSGGEMGKYLQGDLPNQDFVSSRMGSLIDSVKKTKHQSVKNSSSFSIKLLTKKLLPAYVIRYLWGKPEDRKLEATYKKIGKFRLSGEIHQWMYDRFSLSRLLLEVGFKEPKVCTAFESIIPSWHDYHLDVEPDGSIYKPDSLFMEAIK
jgi:predicted SAM-dependent methyltransferase